MVYRIEPFGPQLTPSTATKPQKKGDEDFVDTLKRFVENVDSRIQKADYMMEAFAVGKRTDLHNVMIETEKADLSLRLLLRIRNKLVEAYQEIMRMQI
ncbi:MAG: flagellar hook-basal body complex protein FliE [Deltaproteobacteria bacterium]|nr:flagellar hook-basal body complex protein FliE [Deltaproteobacteria bacterium]MBW1928472.1 flagellar hook-basal body complex protein FliE [Deltaproteobacteria bacterium]MBW2024193.1 flagellar hook-basal body complex protein FliE [Deltaproteobacteria bacterium]MBW2124896.1 flagellar hook-basal body complex protein FliE [Deltaproteobacteria bacterium]RLB20199.1 MAG: flagellar hook-basal body complex protein FliE [Deltaproteobacteria bacterium]